MSRIKCPCCGYYVYENEDDAFCNICEICFWQFDDVAHDHPDIIIGPNHVSLNEARLNFQKYGICELKYKNGVHLREPYDYELPEKNAGM